MRNRFLSSKMLHPDFYQSLHQKAENWHRKPILLEKLRQHSWFFSVIWFDFLPFESVVVEEKREMIAVHLTFSNSVEECNFAFFPFLPKLSNERESESCSFPRKNCTLLYSSEAGLKKSKHHQTVYEITVNVTIYVTTHFCKKKYRLQDLISFLCSL